MTRILINMILGVPFVCGAMCGGAIVGGIAIVVFSLDSSCAVSTLSDPIPVPLWELKHVSP